MTSQDYRRQAFGMQQDPNGLTSEERPSDQEYLSCPLKHNVRAELEDADQQTGKQLFY